MSNDDPRGGSRAGMLAMPSALGDFALSPLAVVLLDALRAGRSWLQLAADLGLMPGEVYTELLPLVAARLVTFEGGEFQPVF